MSLEFPWVQREPDGVRHALKAPIKQPSKTKGKQCLQTIPGLCECQAKALARNTLWQAKAWGSLSWNMPPKHEFTNSMLWEVWISKVLPHAWQMALNNWHLTYKLTHKTTRLPTCGFHCDIQMTPKCFSHRIRQVFVCHRRLNRHWLSNNICQENQSIVNLPWHRNQTSEGQTVRTGWSQRRFVELTKCKVTMCFLNWVIFHDSWTAIRFLQSSIEGFMIQRLALNIESTSPEPKADSQCSSLAMSEVPFFIWLQIEINVSPPLMSTPQSFEGMSDDAVHSLKLFEGVRKCMMMMSDVWRSLRMSLMSIWKSHEMLSDCKSQARQTRPVCCAPLWGQCT